MVSWLVGLADLCGSWLHGRLEVIARIRSLKEHLLLLVDEAAGDIHLHLARVLHLQQEALEDHVFDELVLIMRLVELPSHAHRWVM